MQYLFIWLLACASKKYVIYRTSGADECGEANRPRNPLSPTRQGGRVPSPSGCRPVGWECKDLGGSPRGYPDPPNLPLGGRPRSSRKLAFDRREIDMLILV